MTVALVLAGEADAGLCGQLAALGVRRVDVADRAGPGLLTVAAAARTASERVLICVGEDAVPEEILARLLGAGGTAAFTGVTAGSGGALMVDTPDLDALALTAESLAATDAAPAAVGALVSELTRRGVTVRVLDAGPNSEGAVAQLIVDPAARDVARWAARAPAQPGRAVRNLPRSRGDRRRVVLRAGGAGEAGGDRGPDRLVHRRPGRGPAGGHQPRGPGQARRELARRRVRRC